MMISRCAEALVRKRLAASPAVAIVGPRQAGKTTLARVLSQLYFDLEQPEDRTRLDVRWPDLTRNPGLLVLDEAQTWPDLFARLRGEIDRDRRAGRFLLLGSVSPSLMQHVSESLAGRLSIVELAPLLRVELPGVDLADLWLNGGFPDGGILSQSGFPRWQRDYLALLVQRDLPGWGLPARPQVTDRLLRMLAVSHGQTWNASRIGASLGLSHGTVSHYLDYLEGAFLVRRLAPLHANLGKRLTKTPKIFWRDTGLLHGLLGVTSVDDLLGQPWVGASWEGFVIEQVIGALRAAGSDAQVFFFRTSDGYEIDLVIEGHKERWAVEIKLTTRPAPEDLARLERTAAMIGANRHFLVSQTPESIDNGKSASCSLDWILGRLVELK